MRYLLLTSLLLFSFVGCGPPAPPPTEAEIEQQLQEFGTDNLPSNAKKVVDLGNGWKTFELEIDGEVRKFLYRKSTDLVGEGQHASETVTEIRMKSLPY